MDCLSKKKKEQELSDKRKDIPIGLFPVTWPAAGTTTACHHRTHCAVGSYRATGLHRLP